MGFFTHWPLLLLLAVLMLVVLGPRKMIEMGQALAKAAQETMSQMRQVDWQALIHEEDQPRNDAAHTPPPSHIVEGTAEPAHEDITPPTM